MDLEKIMLSEVSQRKTNIIWYRLFMKSKFLTPFSAEKPWSSDGFTRGRVEPGPTDLSQVCPVSQGPGDGHVADASLGWGAPRSSGLPEALLPQLCVTVGRVRSLQRALEHVWLPGPRVKWRRDCGTAFRLRSCRCARQDGDTLSRTFEKDFRLEANSVISADVAYL